MSSIGGLVHVLARDGLLTNYILTEEKPGEKGRYFSHSCQNRVIVILYDGGGVFVVEHVAYVM